MKRISSLTRRFWFDEDGATMVEYGLMVGLIAVAAMGVVVLMGLATDGLFKSNNDALTKALSNSGS
jgi:pilus assembly protein Flp/PilA